jgi:NDP-sugar pyrophosphorylase family protein
MAVTDIKEKANVVREERASSLKGFFNNCFAPPKPIDNNASEKDTYLENTTYRENDRCSENTIYIKNDTHSENDIYSKNTTLGNAICSDNTIRENNTLENATYSENDIRKNAICSENTTHNGNTVKLAKSLGFTALGVLTVLIDEFPGGSGMLNVTQLSKSCGVARTTLIAQLRSLEKCGAVSLGDVEKNGRWLEIMYSENATCSENTIHIGNAMYGGNNTHIKNAICSENNICIENDIYSTNVSYGDNATCSKNTTYSENDIYIKNTTLDKNLSKSKITQRIAARELYFTAKASQINIDRLSNQCFQQFLSVKHAKGANYAMALFLGLLTKSKEDPTAYVIRAIQRGVTPSQEDQRRAEIISRAAETVFKKIGEEILQRDLDSALQQVSLGDLSQSEIREELDLFAKRISE